MWVGGQARNEALALLCNLSLCEANRAQMCSQRLLDGVLPFMVRLHGDSSRTLRAYSKDGRVVSAIAEHPLEVCALRWL